MDATERWINPPSASPFVLSLILLLFLYSLSNAKHPSNYLVQRVWFHSNRPAMLSKKKPQESVDDILKRLRESPADNDVATETLLERIFSALMSVPATPAGQLHWFCDQASETTFEAASFLLRLYGFNGPAVDSWKQGFQKCLSSCAACIESLECVKVSARSTYVQSLMQFFMEQKCSHAIISVTSLPTTQQR